MDMLSFSSLLIQALLEINCSVNGRLHQFGNDFEREGTKASEVDALNARRIVISKIAF